MRPLPNWTNNQLIAALIAALVGVAASTGLGLLPTLGNSSNTTTVMDAAQSSGPQLEPMDLVTAPQAITIAPIARAGEPDEELTISSIGQESATSLVTTSSAQARAAAQSSTNPSVAETSSTVTQVGVVEDLPTSTMDLATAASTTSPPVQTTASPPSTTVKPPPNIELVKSGNFISSCAEGAIKQNLIVLWDPAPSEQMSLKITAFQGQNQLDALEAIQVYVNLLEDTPDGTRTVSAQRTFSPLAGAPTLGSNGLHNFDISLRVESPSLRAPTQTFDLTLSCKP